MSLPSREGVLSEIRAHKMDMIISSHMHPDDDSIGSVIALHNLLRQEGIHLPIVYPSEKRERWQTIAGYEKIRFVRDLVDYLESPEGMHVTHILLLDAARLSALSMREDRLKCIIQKRNMGFLIIDHHETAEIRGNVLHIQEAGMTSTAELIAQIFLTSHPISQEIAEALLLGILGDTGHLRYIAPSQTAVFDLVKRLIQEGNIHLDEFKSRYDRIPYETLGRLSTLLREAKLMHIPGWPAFILIKNTLEERDEASAAAKELATVLLKQTREASWGVIFSPRQGGKVSLSLRSVPQGIRVVDLVRVMGIGGGHAYAAGGVMSTPLLDDAITLFLRFLQQHSWEDVQDLARGMNEDLDEDERSS